MKNAKSGKQRSEIEARSNQSALHPLVAPQHVPLLPENFRIRTRVRQTFVDPTFPDIHMPHLATSGQMCGGLFRLRCGLVHAKHKRETPRISHSNHLQ